MLGETSLIGAELRLGRLFSKDSGRTFITAVDHGVTLGVPPGAEDGIGTVKRVISCQPDAVLIGPGLFAKTHAQFAYRGAPAVLIRGDFIVNHPYIDDLGEHYRVTVSPEEAVALGADAIVMFLMAGTKNGQLFADNVAAIGKAAQAAHRAGLPLIVESVLWGTRIENKKDPERIAFASRMAVELGADAIKTEYTGDPESMRQVIDGTPAPVLVLGGTKSNDPDAVVDATRQAVTAGAKGVIYGRNVWQADDPAGMAARLRAVIHG